ncbi:MAG: hypothetical protein MZW92_79705 [Comamonadaceae bacterium]|nr:hypothetical protein [Comamonadaceae bacterium]
MMEYCKEHLTGYKVPKHVEFRADLPKTNVGKILRRALRDEETNKQPKKAAWPKPRISPATGAASPLRACR